MSGIILQILVFLVTVLILITIHEFGHFWVAKRLGVKVVRFSIGFGRPLIRWYSKSGTEYRIAWIPLGGYVKLLDEREQTVTEDLKPYAFNRQSLVKRSLIVLAGPAINMLFAILAFWIVWMAGMQQIRPVIADIVPNSIAAQSGLKKGQEIIAVGHELVTSWLQVSLALIKRLGDTGTLVIGVTPLQDRTVHVYQLALKDWKIDALNPDPFKSLGIIPYRPFVPPIIDRVATDSPAEKAGLKTGDRIITLNNLDIKEWKNITDYIQNHPLENIQFVVERAGQKIHVTAESGRQLSGFHWKGYLGIQSAEPVWPEGMRYTPHFSAWGAFERALKDVKDFSVFHFVVLKKMLVGEISLASLSGPVAIYQTTSRAFHEGVIVYLSLLGLISVMLACVNILPIPGLDGGHLLFFLIEGIIRKPVSARVQALVFRLGFILLIVLAVHATINDLMRVANG